MKALNYFKKYRWILVLILMVIPQVQVFATHVGGQQHQGGQQDVDLSSYGKLENPINANSIDELVAKIIKILNLIAVPIVALFLIYSGFLFVKAQGNPADLKKAKDTLLWTVVGAAILLGSYVLAEAISGTIGELQK